MSENEKKSESGRVKPRTERLSMAEFLMKHDDPADQTARKVALSILKARNLPPNHLSPLKLRLTDPNPPNDEITRSVKAQIGTLFGDMLESVWSISEYPDKAEYRMKNIRWAIIEILGPHQIGPTLTEADESKILSGFAQEKPFQIGVVAGVLLQQDPATAEKYIRGKRELINVPPEQAILTRLHSKLIEPNADLTADDKEFFRLIMLEQAASPQISIKLEEDEIFQDISEAFPEKLDEITIPIRKGIYSWVQWALISTRLKATTGKQIDELGKEIIPFLQGRGKKVKSGRIRPGKLEAIKKSILTRSNPLVAAAVNREMISQLRSKNKR